jgi:hypothetical protein
LGELSEVSEDDDEEQAGEVEAEADDEGAEVAAGAEGDGHEEAVEGKLEIHHVLPCVTDEVGGGVEDVAAEDIDPGVEEGEGFGAFEGEDAGEADGEGGDGDADEYGPQGFPPAAGKAFG